MLAAVRRPTERELAILRVLWTRGPSTVREVHDALAGAQNTGYTTTLKLMQIMAEKELVTRDDSARTHIYAPRWSEDVLQRGMLSELKDRFFGGSTAALVLQALNSTSTSAAELRGIREMIDRFRRKTEGR